MARSFFQLRWLVAAFTGTLLLCAAQAQTVDSFNPGSIQSVSALAQGPDGKIYASLDSNARFNLDGTFDATFHTRQSLGMRSFLIRPDGSFESTPGVFSYLPLPDGRLFVITYSWNSYNPGGVFRLNCDGTPDLRISANREIYSVVQQSDGKFVICGGFDRIGGCSLTNIARFDEHGVPDTNFTPPFIRYPLECTAIQPDGKILVGGDFVGPLNTALVRRLNTDGTLDESFSATFLGPPCPPLYSMVVAADGMIYVGGNFYTVNGINCSNLARLNPDGSLDTSFMLNPDGPVSALALQFDGKLLVGGSMRHIGGQPRKSVARINNSTPATSQLSFNESSATWLRGGSSPEISMPTFEFSTNGTQWTQLGQGVRITGGWRVSGVSIPSNATVRARGVVSGGQFNGSAWFATESAGPVVIVTQPSSRIDAFSSNVLFTVTTAGSPASFQWLKNGVALDEGGNVTGSQRTELWLSNVTGADSGDYRIVVSNAFGAVTSSVATLSVQDPLITGQPIAVAATVGNTVTFKATVAGSSPLSWQWRKNGEPIPGAIYPSLVLSNISTFDEAAYNLVVTNQFGRQTSEPATLEVNLITVQRSIDFYPSCIALQANGSLLVSDAYTTYGRNCFTRLTSDGKLDANFELQSPDMVSAASIQPDGKTVFGGYFKWINDIPCERLARIDSNGVLDTNFQGSADWPVRVLATQPDGKILAGGIFSILNGQPRNALGRLNPDGTLDSAFNLGIKSSLWSHVATIALQPDNKILFGGYFDSVSSETRYNIARSNPDGTLDPDFNPGADDLVCAIAPQNDGKILVGGSFTNLGGFASRGLGRLNSDGTVDRSFNAPVNGTVRCIALQSNGKILVAGDFSTVAGVKRWGMARLNPDGSVDPGFFPQPGWPDTNGSIYTLVIRPDGRLMVGGSFAITAGIITGESFNSFVLLNNNDPAEQILSVTGSTARWQLKGSFPQLGNVQFEISKDGNEWVNAGSGRCVPGGWELSGLSLSPGDTIRARGSATFASTSTGVFESTAQVTAQTQPEIMTFRREQGSSRTRFQIGALNRQSVVVEGSTNLLNWRSLSTNTIEAGSGIFDEEFGTPSRFYRLRILEKTTP